MGLCPVFALKFGMGKSARLSLLTEHRGFGFQQLFTKAIKNKCGIINMETFSVVEGALNY